MSPSHENSDLELPGVAALADQPLDAIDAALLNSIRAWVDEHDPVPDGLVERIQFEMTLDALHAEVATLTQNSLPLAGVRGPTAEAVQTVTFTSQSLTTMITVTPERGGTVRIDGWIAPESRVDVELHGAAGRQATAADDDGRFVFERVPSGQVKFVLTAQRPDATITVVSPTIEV